MWVRGMVLGLLAGCAPVQLQIIPLDTDGADTSEPVVDNVAPVADAGEDVRVPVGTPLEWAPSGSYDPDGDALTYQWQVIEAPEGSRATARTRPDGRVAFDPDVVGFFTLGLTVDDGRGGTDADQVDVESVDTWALGGGRPSPGHVYMLGSIADECDRGLSELGTDPLAVVGLDCRAEREQTFVQLDATVWWYDGRSAREMACDGPCTVRRADRYPSGDLVENDPEVELPCARSSEVLFGPGHSLARCVGDADTWVGPRGAYASPRWQPFALGVGDLVLVRGVAGSNRDEIGVLDLSIGEVVPTDPALSWQFLRAWRSFEDGFRVAAYDNRERTTLVEVSADGQVVNAGSYTALPEDITVLIGSRLDSAGNLFLPVRADGRFQIVKSEVDGGIESAHDDARSPLVRIAGGGELVTGR